MDIKRIIKAKGMTIEEVAARMKGNKGVGIKQSSLSQMINGNPSVSTLREIASVIDCNIADFFTDETKTDNSLKCPHCGNPLVCKNCGHVIRLAE